MVSKEAVALDGRVKPGHDVAGRMTRTRAVNLVRSALIGMLMATAGVERAMATDEEIAAAEADLQSAQAELQSKLTRSLPDGVMIAKPDVGMELKRLREDVEAKQRRLDDLRKE